MFYNLFLPNSDLNVGSLIGFDYSASKIKSYHISPSNVLINPIFEFIVYTSKGKYIKL